ncbi:MAG: CDP-alcohol phosphatidyltransferase family protein [Chloroflexi bacterium]|nr:CDP-alcohol phosphatidyltransferase family protein [Chloroflexota bacterium]
MSSPVSHGVVSARAARATRGALAPLGRALAAIGVTPNAITAFGVLLTLVGSALLAQERPLVALAFLAAGSLADTLDGVVARASSGGTKLGAFLDSTADRVADAVLFAAAAYVGSSRGDAVLFWGSLGALSASFLVSYTRAKAESLGIGATVGPAPREARLVILLLGIVGWALLGTLAAFTTAIVAVAILATITLVQRTALVARSLAKKTSGET